MRPKRGPIEIFLKTSLNKTKNERNQWLSSSCHYKRTNYSPSLCSVGDL